MKATYRSSQPSGPTHPKDTELTQSDACDPGGSTTENSREVEDLRELTQ